MRRPLLELSFPRFCLGCGYVGTYVCSPCEAKMKRVKHNTCFYCEKPSLFGLTHPRCRRKNGIDGYLSVYVYDGLFKMVLQEAKYKGAHKTLDELLSYFQSHTTKNIHKWIEMFKPYVLSVPLHPQRIRERGFNQTDMIAKRYFNNAFLSKQDLLRRAINTDHLANMEDKASRKRHVRGAFVFVKQAEIVPDAVVLVDDVATSGSTLLECAKELKENGIRTVLAFSLAKG